MEKKPFYTTKEILDWGLLLNSLGKKTKSRHTVATIAKKMGIKKTDKIFIFTQEQIDSWNNSVSK